MYLQVTKLTEFLIDNCPQIFGEDVLALYGDSDEDELSDNQGNFFFKCSLLGCLYTGVKIANSF